MNFKKGRLQQRLLQVATTFQNTFPDRQLLEGCSNVVKSPHIYQGWVTSIIALDIPLKHAGEALPGETPSRQCWRVALSDGIEPFP
eukprot:symbB.v1.2.024054.t1/scaffold2246.1/size98716/3